MLQSTLCYIRKDGKVLMLLRNKKQNDLNAGKWIGVGGKVEKGERVSDCLIREVKEEAGVTLTAYKKIGIIDFKQNKNFSERMHLYIADGYEGEIDFDCPEGTLEWIPESEILNLNLWEGDRVFLEPMLKGKENIRLKLDYQEDRLIRVREKEKSADFVAGLHAGIPIGLGYFAVAFSLGISAKHCGITPFQGFLASLLTIASAGEYMGFSLIGAAAGYLEMALLILITNSRYLLMSFALNQKVKPEEKMIHRIGIGLFITDEIFGLHISRQRPASAWYTYGTALVSVLPWAFGTMLGIIMGNVLPEIVVSSLSVSIFGMFIAIIVPPSREDRTVLLAVLISFLLSLAVRYIPIIQEWSDGIRTLILTMVISAFFAAWKPLKDAKETTEARHE